MSCFLPDLSKRFIRNTRGNLGVIFAIACVPLITAVGAAVDYSFAVRMKAKMQGAADAAAVGSISIGSPAYVQAGQMGGTGPIPAGNTDAANIFNGNLNGVTGYTGLTVTPTVTKTATTLTSDITFSASVRTTFLGVIGFQQLSFSGSSHASGELPMYLDFYMLLDTSGSMGLPSTPAEETRLSQVNPDMFGQYPTGCTFACHFTISNGCGNSNQKYNTNNYCLGYLISRTSQTAFKQLIANHSGSIPQTRVSAAPETPLTTPLPFPQQFYGSDSTNPNDPTLAAVSNCPTDGTDACIQLRLDAVGYALTQLFQTAYNKQLLPQQFRIGLYPFIRTMDSNYFPLTYSFNNNPGTSGTINYAAANLAAELDTNANSALGSGGTHIDTAISSMNTLITSVGNGTSPSSTLPYVFLITDGAQDPQVKGINGGGWSGSNHATVINPTTVCQPLKNRGIVIAVLYIPYQPINPVNASFANDEDDAANNNIPNIPGSLSSCASPGFFFTANTPQDIKDALNKMFQKSLQTAHITH